MILQTRWIATHTHRTQTNGKGDSDKFNRGLKKLLQTSRLLLMPNNSKANKSCHDNLPTKKTSLGGLKEPGNVYFHHILLMSLCGSQGVHFVDVWNLKHNGNLDQHWDYLSVRHPLKNCSGFALDPGLSGKQLCQGHNFQNKISLQLPCLLHLRDNKNQRYSEEPR